MPIDHAIALAVNQLSLSSETLASLIGFFARAFPFLLAGLCAVLLMALRKGYRERLLLLIEAGAAAVISRWVFVEAIRFFFDRPRPFVLDPAIVPLFDKTTGSFPSGHMAFFFAIATTVFLYNKKWGIALYVASALIGIARVGAGVHYPTDILGGAVLGAAVSYGAHFAMLRLTRRKAA